MDTLICVCDWPDSVESEFYCNAWIGAAIGAGASLIGSSMNSAAVSDTNAQSLQVNRENRDWAGMMSNTAEQRHVADLKAAGLNPALAYSTAAPVPGMPNNPALSPPQPGAGLMQSAGQLAQVGTAISQQKLLNAQADKTSADAATVRAVLPYSGPSAQATLDNMRRQNDVLVQQADNLMADFRIKWDAQLPMLMKDKDFQERFLDLKQQVQELDVQRSRLGMPRLENDSAWQLGHPVLSGWLQSGAVDSGINAAGKVIGALGVRKSVNIQNARAFGQGAVANTGDAP